MDELARAVDGPEGMVYLQKVQTATKIESYPLGAAGIDITSHATLANGIGAEIVTRGLAYCA